MALNRSAPLGHPMCFGTFYRAIFDHAGLTKDIRSEDRPLPANADNKDIITLFHFPPPGVMAPEGQICEHSEHPLHPAVITAFSPAISIAGHPNLTQVPQPVHFSLSIL